jgi:hypothetical protein
VRTGTHPATDEQFNEVFERNHGAASRAYYAHDARTADIGATFYDLTESRNYGKSKRRGGAE